MDNKTKAWKKAKNVFKKVTCDRVCFWWRSLAHSWCTLYSKITLPNIKYKIEAKKNRQLSLF